MFRNARRPDDFRRRFTTQVLLPLLCVLAIAFLTSGFIFYWALTRGDAAAIERQRQVVEAAIDASLRNVAKQQRSEARWEPLAQQLLKPTLDPNWFDENIGAWVYTMFGHQQVYILDPKNVPVYGAVAGVRAAPESFAQVSADLLPLIAALRQSLIPHRQAADFAALQAPAKADPDGMPDIQRADLMLVQGRPAVVSAIPVLPAREELQQHQFSRYLMVDVKFLDGAYLNELARRSMLGGVHFSKTGQGNHGEQALALAGRDGRQIGYVMWQPDLPGTRLMKVIGPVIAVVLLAIIGIIVWLARSLWRSMSNLSKTLIELRASEAQAQHLAFHDVLTGLPNRALFEDRINQALARVRRGERIALLALDLDRFKHVNDTLGHHAGDGLINEVAARLCTLVRATDTVARVGGDEFVIIQTDIAAASDAETLCQRIFETIREPFNLLGDQTHIGVSIGIALAPEDATERAELMRKADIALYVAKRSGRDRRQYFTRSMDDTIRLRRDIEAELRAALARPGELQVYYQPEVDVSGHRVVGLEALIRWNHPIRGFIAPDEFIPIAEETGLILPLGEWVLREACRTARRWPELFMAVNLSPVQFRSVEFAARVVEIVAEQGCDPAQIELEITEGVLLEDDDACRLALQTLRQAGFKIALDDFGTGYSSLSYLRRFQVDKIKIDRSFTQNLGESDDSAAIVESVITLGRAMGLTVTAEGVETRDQMSALAAAGCNELQGYLFSRAVPEDQLEKRIADVRSEP